jgi:hypothetical protein
MKLLYTLDEEHARLVFYMAPKMEDWFFYKPNAYKFI